MRERDIFDAALAIADPAERSAYLAEVSAENPGLRQHIEGLLDMHGRLGSFLEAPAAALTATVDPLPAEGPGTVIGPYKLLEQIGEGGMGLVFMADQLQPVRRRVALKVLKPGMDTRQVVARFEAERQALALMDHPHIAKVFDGGATASGRPYFVMELVRGVPITEFCDQRRLTPRQRLELFALVCQAVQHAHQKGIIHRDLKPSNVLVTLHDTVAVPKVIDFGIAKATTQTLTERTLFTHFAQMLGTPLYMSPEQAGQSGLDVDARSDVYSLGVLLYELLTGTTPLDQERFKEADSDEMRRIIREEGPPRPSTRISTLAQAAMTVSTKRKSDPNELSRVYRGKLDCIVMKALEKDRNRRYESASAFAADVQRYLNDEPVHACPPAIAGRSRALQHGGLLAAVVGLLALLAVGSFFGGQVIRLATNRALVVIQVDDPKVDVTVKEGGAVIRDPAGQREITLAAGEHELEITIKDAAGETHFLTKNLSLKRGGKEIIIVQQELAGDPERQVAEWVVSLGGKVAVRAANDEPKKVGAASDLPPDGDWQVVKVDLEHNRLISNTMLVRLKTARKLAELCLDHTQVSDGGLEHLTALVDLTTLEISDTKVTDAGLVHLGALKKLTKLDLHSTQVSDAGTVHLAKLSSLTKLGLDGTQVSDVGLARLTALKKLTALSIKETQVTDAGLEYLKALPNLVQLFVGSGRVTDAGVKRLTDLKQLFDLELDGSNVTDDGLAHLKGLTNLRRLSLNGTAIRGAGLAHLKALPGLVELRLGCPKLTDQHLGQLGEMKSLALLSLAGSGVTDDGLKALYGLTQLQELDLTRTKVTPEGVAALKKILPKCRIVSGPTAK